MRPVCFLLFALILPAAGAVTNAASGRIEITSSFLTGLVEEARTNHPGLRGADLRQHAAQRGMDAVRTWADPSFRFGGVVASESGPDLRADGDLVYELEQPLPLFGKAAAARKEAEAGVAVATAASAAEFQLLRRAIVQAVHQLAYVDEILRFGAEDLSLLERLTALTRERQHAGNESSLELLRFETDLQKRRQQLDTDRLQRDFERVNLNRLLARPIEGTWPEFELPPIAPAIPLSEELFRLGIRYEPRLQVLRREIEQAEAGIGVARKSRLPDVRLGIEGRQWTGSGDFQEGQFTVGLNLPWFNRQHYRADLDRSQDLASAGRADLENQELEVRRELFRIWTRIDSSRREALLYRDQILPRAALAVETALAGWAAGRSLYLEVHDARRFLVEARLMHARARNEQHQMIADLVTCCGVAELDSLIMLQPTPNAPKP